MALPSRPQSPKIRSVRYNRRSPAVSVQDLALMLEIDVALGRHGAFRRRLQGALEDSREQGMEWLMSAENLDATIMRLAARAQK